MAGKAANAEDSAECAGGTEPSGQECMETGQRGTCLSSVLSDHRQVQVLEPTN
ncbi:hypothetical protein I79_021413 [Cricetulus griseus]|uniref:Uncharacterized protein n=1 Tax=Cricetulus griseus TaxID=10029 RepID=G3ICL5_CRIGR|nr:hypothetical protein I79_021413 [Cricetulus griseus]